MEYNKFNVCKIVGIKSFPIEEGKILLVSNFWLRVASCYLVFLTSNPQLFFQKFNLLLQIFVLFFPLCILLLKNFEILLENVIFLPENLVFLFEVMDVIVLHQWSGAISFLFTPEFILFSWVLCFLSGDEEIHVRVGFVFSFYHVLFCIIIQSNWEWELVWLTDY